MSGIDNGAIKNSIADSKAQQEASNLAAQESDERASNFSAETKADNTEISALQAAVRRVDAELRIYREDLKNPPTKEVEDKPKKFISSVHRGKDGKKSDVGTAIKRMKILSSPTLTTMYAVDKIRREHKGKNGPKFKRVVDEQAVHKLKKKIKELEVTKAALHSRINKLKQNTSQNAQNQKQEQSDSQIHKQKAREEDKNVSEFSKQLKTDQD